MQQVDLQAQLDRAPDLLAARKVLLTTEFLNGRWTRLTDEPPLLNPKPQRDWWGPPAPFALHEVFDLPDNPPVEGASSSRVHRFVLKADSAAALNAQLGAEAQRQAWYQFSGEQKSNVGGFHGQEVAFDGSSSDAWYATLHAQVLLPALRFLQGEGSGGRGVVDADGVPLEGRVSG